MRRTTGWVACIIFSASMIVTTVAIAQLPTATILGSVTDASGGVIAGASLTARDADTGLSRTVTTEENGEYQFSALPVGNYEVKVEHTGFETAVRTGLTLTVAQQAVVNFTLKVGSAEQSVSVTAEAPLVNTTSGSLGGLVDQTQVSDLPLNGRNFMDLTFLEPGVIQQKNLAATGSAILGEWYSSNGAPLRSNNFTIDGAIMQDANGGGPASVAGTTTGIDGLREYRVITTDFSAEYGLTMGSQQVMVSKSGTNAYHGSAFEFLRNSAMDAANFFDTPASSGGHRLPEFRRNNFGGSFGGPIKKDKLFFFAATEFLRQALGLTTVSTFPQAGCHGPAGAVIWNGLGAPPSGSIGPCTALGTNPSSISPSAQCPAVSNCVVISPVAAPLLALYSLPTNSSATNNFSFPFTQPSHDNWGQIRVDYNLSAKDSLFARYTIDDSQLTTDTASPLFTSILTSRSQYITVSDSHIFSPTLLNTVRGSFSRTDPTSVPGFPSNVVGPQYSFVTGYPVGSITPGSNITAISPSFVTIYNQNLYTIGDDLFYTKGIHSLKFGTLVNFYRYDTANESNQIGALTFPNMAYFLQGLATTVTAELPNLIQERIYHYSTYGWYAQDDIRVRRNLTVNLGLRYEFYTVPRDVEGRNDALLNNVTGTSFTPGPIMRNPSLHDFSPRLGFAWDVMGDGKTSVRGGAAILYDIGDLGSALNHDATAKPPYSLQATIAGSTSAPIPVILPLTFTTSEIGKTLRQLDYNFGQPLLRTYNLAVERQLPYTMALTVAYAGSRGINLAQILEGNPAIPAGVPLNAGTPFESCVPGAGPAPSNFSVIDGAATACFLGNEPKRNPAWGTMNMETTGGQSWYNSLQVSLQKRTSKGLQFQSAFTWSQLLDLQGDGQYNSEDGNSENNFCPDPLHTLQVCKGRAAFNSALNWKFNTTYNLPNFVSGSGFLAGLANGWWTSGIISLQSGYPFTPVLQTQRSRSGVQAGAAGIDRPDLVTNANLAAAMLADPLAQVYNPSTVITGNPNQWFNPHMFTDPPAGFEGNAGRNPLLGPAFADVDMTVAKDIGLRFLGEGGKLQLRAEIFNLFNHPNFAIPANRTVLTGALTSDTYSNPGGVLAVSNPDVPLSSAGAISKTVGPSRQLQISAKIVW